MLLKHEILKRIANGDVTLVFRRWKRPTVKAGGELKTMVGVLAIDEVQATSLASITVDDARCAGFDTKTELTKTLAGRPGKVYRIAVRFAGADPRLSLRTKPITSDAEMQELAAQLERMDAASRDGAWTLQYLQLIAEQPETLAADMAASIGSTKKRFKPRVRKLKELGLTISHKPGYRLSRRGESYLSRLQTRETSWRTLC